MSHEMNSLKLFDQFEYFVLCIMHLMHFKSVKWIFTH